MAPIDAVASVASTGMRGPRVAAMTIAAHAAPIVGCMYGSPGSVPMLRGAQHARRAAGAARAALERIVERLDLRGARRERPGR